MQNQSKRPYKITVILSGRTNQVENPNPDGSYTFSPHVGKIGDCRNTAFLLPLRLQGRKNY